MRKLLTNGFILIISFVMVLSCDTSLTSKIQGVFEVDKESLKKSLQTKMEGENAIAIGLLNVALENAVIEFCIKGDSIRGILFMAGETTLLESQIYERNDSLIINTNKSEAYLIPTEKGLSLMVFGSNTALELNKTDRAELSPQTKKAIEAQKVAIKEKEEFEQNLGKWKEGNIVDDFGDKTGEGYAYCLVRGTNENLISTKNEVYVKAMIQNKKLIFQIYNSSFSLKESFPDNKFGKMKLKFPDGSIQSEDIFFYKNLITEFGDKAILLDFISQNDGEVKIFIDLSTVSNYYSDTFQFSIEKNNLSEVLKSIKR